MGVSTIALSDGSERLLTDGFFSRPALWRLPFAAEPDASRISEALTRANIKEAAAVLVAHAHFDHAMDAPNVAEATGAALIGSSSVLNIAKGQSTPIQSRRVGRGDRLCFGQFTVEVFEGPHSKTGPIRHWLFDGAINKPLRSPARAWDYKDEGSLSYLVKHPQATVLLHASPNFEPGQFTGLGADVVFLAIGDLRADSPFLEKYWRALVCDTGAKVVIPTHWDNFTRGLDKPLKPIPWPFANHRAAAKRLEILSRRDGVKLVWPEPFENLDLGALAAGPPARCANSPA